MFDASIAAAPGLPAPLALHPLIQSLIDQIGSGLILCDADGRVHLANRAARGELEHGRLLRVSAGGLQRAGGASGDLAGAIRLAATRGRRSLVRLDAGDDRLFASVLPLPEGGETLVVVVLGRRVPCGELELQLLAASYGLTHAERRVLARLMHAERPAEIARRHAVKLSTVRTQISSIRAKLGTRSVEGLLLRAAELPSMPSALMLGLAAGPH